MKLILKYIGRYKLSLFLLIASLVASIMLQL